MKGYVIPLLLVSILMIGANTGNVTQASTMLAMLNVWHIPTNSEPPSVTMRNPVLVTPTTGNVYFYVGGYPQGSIWSGALYYRVQGSGTWTSTAFNFDSNNGSNEYWLSNIVNTYSQGQVIQYYLKLTGGSGTDTTYVYGTDTTSNKTTTESVAQGAPFSFTVQSINPPTSTPTTAPGTVTPTATPLPLMNIWHIPGNVEPSPVTMRNPLNPDTNTQNVYIYLGGYPQSSIYSGALYYRASGAPSWSTATLNYDSNQGANEYWIASFANSFTGGTVVQYYLKAAGNPVQYRTTYVYQVSGNSTTTDTEATAQTSPFSFTVTQAATPTVTLTPTPGTGTATTTPTTLPLLTAWHIPANVEPSPVTMRNPLAPTTSTETVFIYTGCFPQYTVWSGTLFYKTSSASEWNSAAVTFDVNQGINEYWLASFTNAFSVGTQVQYYIRVSGNPAQFSTTYIYQSGGNSTTTGSESIAQASPFSFTVLLGPTPVPLPTINAWHIPANIEPSPVTMRNPLQPNTNSEKIFIYAGANPQGTIQSGTLYYRQSDAQTWSSASFTFDTNHSVNEYWISEITNQYAGGATVQYYLKLNGNPSTYKTTYVCFIEGNSTPVTQEYLAQEHPFAFTMITFTPTPSPTPSGSPVLPLINAWHIASNNEPHITTMRSPAFPTTGSPTINIYIGAYPQYTLWNGGSLYYRKSGTTTWSTASIEFSTNENSNEYWVGSITNSFQAGDTIEYYAKVVGNPSTYSNTYLYGDDFHSNSTGVEATAQASAFTFQITGSASPTPTATPGGLPLINVWHIPANNEPPSVTMRNPLNPTTAHQNVYIYVGGYPQGVIWSGTLYHRKSGETWSNTSFAFDSNNASNGYWMATFTNYPLNSVVEYYIKIESDPAAYLPTYIHFDSEAAYGITSVQAEAIAAPFTFTVQASTATPTPTPALMNVWHIPTNWEPLGVTMRNPIAPYHDWINIYFYVGSHPQSIIETGTLYFRVQGTTTWQSSVMTWDSHNWENAYWWTHIPINQFAINDVVEYYFKITSPSFTTTYLFGDDTHSNATANETQAQEDPYLVTIIAQPTPGPSPTPLMNVWHIPNNNEPPSVTMRNPVSPKTGDSIIYIYVGGYPFRYVGDLPQSVIWSGTLYYRGQGVGPWLSANFQFDSGHEPNEYWIASFSNSFAANTTVEYYLKLQGDQYQYAPTFLYGDDAHSNTTSQQSVASSNPYTFVVQSQPTPTCNTLNTWHIPVNNEPSFPDITMRRPLIPRITDTLIYFYVGGYPNPIIWSEYTNLWYHKHGESTWQSQRLLFDSASPNQNEYFTTSIPNTYQVNDTIDYYLQVASRDAQYDTTYLYGDDTHSNKTCDENVARQFPYSFIISGTPLPTTTPINTVTPSRTPTRTPITTPSTIPTFNSAGFILLLLCLTTLLQIRNKRHRT